MRNEIKKRKKSLRKVFIMTIVVSFSVSFGLINNAFPRSMNYFHRKKKVPTKIAE